MSRPHKCPVCDGTGRRVEQTSTGASEGVCPACGGAGVLWEPGAAQEAAPGMTGDDVKDLTYRRG